MADLKRGHLGGKEKGSRNCLASVILACGQKGVPEHERGACIAHIHTKKKRTRAFAPETMGWWDMLSGAPLDKERRMRCRREDEGGIGPGKKRAKARKNSYSALSGGIPMGPVGGRMGE